MEGKFHRGGFVSKENEANVPIKSLVKIVEITKAGSIGDQAPVDTTIVISGEPPPIDQVDNRGWEKRYKAFYGEQADLLFDALVKSLPGGTLGQLAVRLLDKYSSLLRVTL